MIIIVHSHNNAKFWKMCEGFSIELCLLRLREPFLGVKRLVFWSVPIDDTKILLCGASPNSKEIHISVMYNRT